MRPFRKRFQSRKTTTSLVYICNPNNPTGSLTPRKDLEAFIQKLPRTTTVLMDEAYHHFVEKSAAYSSFIENPINDDRVLVARTFSKVFGLAGMRIGYAFGSPEKIQALSARRLAQGLNAFGARAALIAYDDLEYVQMSENRNAAGRANFSVRLNPGKYSSSIRTRTSPCFRPGAPPRTSSSISAKTTCSSRASSPR